MPDSGASSEPDHATENASAVMPSTGLFVPQSRSTTASSRRSTLRSFLFMPLDWKYSAASPPRRVACFTVPKPANKSATLAWCCSWVSRCNSSRAGDNRARASAE